MLLVKQLLLWLLPVKLSVCPCLQKRYSVYKAGPMVPGGAGTESGPLVSIIQMASVSSTPASDSDIDERT